VGPQPFVKRKNGICIRTYAQNTCCSAQDFRVTHLPCFQRDSKAKSLIYIEFELCFFSGKSSRSLDFQGLAASPARLSTKLSTGTLDEGQSAEKSTT
jgi:hypothetical protein